MPTRTERLREAIKNIADSDAAERQRQGLQDVPVGSSQNPSTKILTVANVITFCRLALTLVFLVLFIRHEHRVAALACYAVAAVTDFLDGQIARRTQTVSWLGKIMDPVMDRVLLFTGVLGLLFNGELPLWVPVFVIGRDVYLAIGGAVLQRYRKRPVDVVY
ncbi:MAG: CDP-alcohol phosphatidyltransferase family protein, partial [Paratractidigestivibacter faecalis]